MARLPHLRRPTAGTGNPHRLVAPGDAIAAAVPLVLVVAAAVVLAQALARRWAAASALGTLVPLQFPLPDPDIAIVAAIGLLAVAIGLARGKRLAWLVAVVVLAAALLTDAVVHHRVIAALIAAGCLVALGAARPRYVARSDARWRRRALVLLAISAVATGLEVALWVAAPWHGSGVRPSPGALVSAISTWLAFGDPEALMRASRGVLAILLELASRVPLVLVALAILQPDEERQDVRMRAHRITVEFGRGSLLPFQVGIDKLGFTTDGRDGAVVYGRAGRTAVVLGDPIGPDGDAWAVFADFLDRCRTLDYVPAVYQATGVSRERLLHHGFTCFRIGQEAVIDLASFSLQGSRRANLRHTVTRARRGGVEAMFRHSGLSAAERARLGPELARIDEAWRTKTGPELGFTIGRFSADDLATTPIAISTRDDGRVQAFATFRPVGPDGSWVLDLLRRAPGSVPGSMESCVVAAAEALRDAGATTLSLGLAPLAGLDPSTGPLEERLLARAARVVRPLYDVHGLAFFKGKFDPTWVPRYAATRRRRDLAGLALGLLALHLGSPRAFVAASVSSTLRLVRPAGGAPAA